MISVEGVTKRYGDVVAVDDLTFEVQRGEVVGFLGPNGAGKSTTMKMITGTLQPDGGVVRFDGASIAEDLTGAKLSGEQGKTNEGVAKLCDVCEDKSVAHWCHVCEQWMCDHCKDIHRRVKGTNSHRFSSLPARNKKTKAAVQRLIQNFSFKITACEKTECLAEERLVELATVKTRALKDCNALRVKCHSQIDRQFDDLEKQIKIKCGYLFKYGRLNIFSFRCQ